MIYAIFVFQPVPLQLLKPAQWMVMISFNMRMEEDIQRKDASLFSNQPSSQTLPSINCLLSVIFLCSYLSVQIEDCRHKILSYLHLFWLKFLQFLIRYVVYKYFSVYWQRIFVKPLLTLQLFFQLLELIKNVLVISE